MWPYMAGDIGAIKLRVIVEPPLYQGVMVVARVRAWRTARAQDVEQRALTYIYRYLHPVLGGPAGSGWPLGRPLTPGEIHAALTGMPGVDMVEDVLLFGVSTETNQTAGQPSARLELPPNALFYSSGHQVRVQVSV